MRESSTYQAILEEGREEGREEGERRAARQIVLELGTDKLGPPDAAVVARLERLDDLAVLHQLARGVLRASTWQELLAILGER